MNAYSVPHDGTRIPYSGIVSYAGDVFERGQDGYERARRAACWNARTPERYPDVIVQAHTETDVVTAVREARDAGIKIGVRSGGHSWSGNHVRDGGMLLDVSRLRDVEIDAAAMTATVQTGCPGDVLLAALDGQDLFFPGGHCNGVAVGGYLLQGGYGWNGRVHGPACLSVLAIDLVTADGELVRADSEQNSDLYWAARGSGPGFFGAVTRFHVRLHPKPKVIANGVYMYPGELLEELFTWAYEIGPQVSRKMELMLLIHRPAEGEPEVVVTGPVLADSEAEAAAALSLLGTCPVVSQAKVAAPNVPATMPDLYANTHILYPDGHRYAVDNMWTHADIKDLLPGLRRIADTMPPTPSHMLWMNWRPGQEPGPARPDMAYSLEDDTYIAAYAGWSDPADDDARIAWVTERMREMEPHATGIQLADENLGRRPARFVTDDSLARLDQIRAARDPDGRFHPWMGRP